MLLRGPPLSPGVVRGVGTTSRDPLPRAPLKVGPSAAEWEILDGKRVDLQSGAPGPARARAGPGPRALPGRPACPSRARPLRPGPQLYPAASYLMYRMLKLWPTSDRAVNVNRVVPALWVVAARKGGLPDA